MNQLLLRCLTGVIMVLAYGIPRASAQNFNIDFGGTFGTPASTYGAAAGQVGAWTTIRVTGSALALTNLDGSSSSRRLTLTADDPMGFSGGGYHTGNQSALLDDDFYSTSPALWSLAITGLTNGNYTLYYYAPSNSLTDTGAFTANGVAAASITGSMSGFSQGVDWQVLRGVVVADGTMTLTDTTNPQFAGLAGLQLVVPEPSTWALLGVGIFTTGLAWRRKQARKAA